MVLLLDAFRGFREERGHASGSRLATLRQLGVCYALVGYAVRLLFRDLHGPPSRVLDSSNARSSMYAFARHIHVLGLSIADALEIGATPAHRKIGS